MTSIRKTLTLLIASGVTGAAMLTLVSLWGATRTADVVERVFVAKDVTADILPPPMYLIELRLVISQAAEGTMPIARAHSEMERLVTEYEARVDHWNEHPPFGLERELLGRQHRAAEQFFGSARSVLAALASADAATARTALANAHVDYLEHRAGVDQTVAASLEFAEESMSEFAAANDFVLKVVWAMLAATSLALIGLGAWARRSFLAQTGGEPAEAAAIANAVARGDLSIDVPVAPGDTQSVMAALARMCRNLSTLVGTVRQSSDSIAAGSSQIASGNSDLSQRTDQQAAHLQQTAASMQQVRSIVDANAGAAAQAVELADAAREVAGRGGAVVTEVIATMNDIAASSKRITDIVAVIDDIAFQTNILALNAAVEAARAGQQGVGFAVVASEVRSLARRSADAAKEIKALIGASADKVDVGSRLVRDAGETMSEIVTQAGQVADLITRISTANAQQTSGIGQISSAVSQLDESTQQNAALVQQSAAAAASLNELASQLVQAVSAFRLEQRVGAAAA